MRLLLLWTPQDAGNPQCYQHLDPVVAMPDGHFWSWREQKPPQYGASIGDPRFVHIDVPRVPAECFSFLFESIEGQILTRHWDGGEDWRAPVKQLRRYTMRFSDVDRRTLFLRGELVLSLEEFQVCIVDRAIASAPTRPYLYHAAGVR